MKIILSRKGFDGASGGVPSPIFPGGGLCSLPIPQESDTKRRGVPKDRVRFKDLSYNGHSLGSIVEDLTSNKRRGAPRIKGNGLCHLDPDLIRVDLHRRRGWLPMFGQANAALTHLLVTHDVREGDLFLFFGWFRGVRESQGHYAFEPGESDRHVIFGWLQVGDIWCQFSRDSIPGWARYHPHVRGEVKDLHNLGKPGNAVFIAKRKLDLDCVSRPLHGGGVFKTFHSDLCLTDTGGPRGKWRIPSWMYPFPDLLPLSYHGTSASWKKSGKWAILQTVGRGQEFILDLDSPGCGDKYPKDRASEWLKRLFRHAA